MSIDYIAKCYRVRDGKISRHPEGDIEGNSNWLDELQTLLWYMEGSCSETPTLFYRIEEVLGKDGGCRYE